MTDSEVHEMLAMLVRRYPNFPDDDPDLWVQSFAVVNAQAAFAAVANWCHKHAVWPTIAEIHESIYRMTEGMHRGKAKMWDAYVAECARQGRQPTAEFLQPPVPA